METLVVLDTIATTAMMNCQVKMTIPAMRRHQVTLPTVKGTTDL